MKRNSHMVVMLILRPLLPVLKSAFLYTYAFLQISLKEPLVTTTLMLSVVSTSKCGKRPPPRMWMGLFHLAPLLPSRVVSFTPSLASWIPLCKIGPTWDCLWQVGRDFDLDHSVNIHGVVLLACREWQARNPISRTLLAAGVPRQVLCPAGQTSGW